MATSIKTLAEQIAHRSGRLGDYVFIKDVRTSILDLRSLFLRRQTERYQRIPQSAYTRMKGVEMEVADIAEICDGSVNIGCNVLRTKDPLPKVMEFQGNSPFSYVGSISFKKSYDFITVSDIQFIQWSRFAGNRTKYTYIDDRIYVFNNITLDMISLIGVFVDPEEVIALCEEAGGNCEHDEFILESHLVPLIKGELYKEYGLQQVEEFPKQEEVEVDE